MSRIYKKVSGSFKIVLVVFLAIFLFYIFYEIQNLRSARNLSAHYISQGVEETGAINLVTSVLYDYRGFDTLGEATVLLTAAAMVAFLVPKRKVTIPGTKLTTFSFPAIKIFVFFLAVLGMYLIFFGHVSPGGGFTGGVILALVPIVLTISYSIDFSEDKLKPTHKSLLENTGATGFILLGLLGILAGSNFLASGQAGFGPGDPGELVSAGLIPYLNLMIGIKVGAGLAIIFNSLIKED